MPKPIDEDRARRKRELEMKRAARRAAKEESQQQQQERKSSADAGGGAASPPVSSLDDSTAKSPTSSYLLELPEVAVHVIFGHLSAADLGRLTMTCKQLNLSKLQQTNYCTKIRKSRNLKLKLKFSYLQSLSFSLLVGFVKQYCRSNAIKCCPTLGPLYFFRG